MSKRKISFGSKGGSPKKRRLVDEFFNPEEAIKNYNKFLKDSNEPGELKRCKGKTKLTWQGKLSVSPGFQNCEMVTVFITFYKASFNRCPDFSVKEYPKLIYVKELSTLFKRWKKWKSSDKLPRLFEAIQRACQMCLYEQRKELSPVAEKWMTDLFEFIKKSKIKRLLISKNEESKRFRFVMKLTKIEKVWDRPIIALSFGDDTAYTPKNKNLLFGKSCPESFKRLDNYMDCKSPREVLKKIIQLCYKQKRIEYRSCDLVDYMALQLQQSIGTILQKTEKTIVFMHKPGDKTTLNLGLVWKLGFEQEPTGDFKFRLQQQPITKGGFRKGKLMSWFWTEDWEGKADMILTRIKRELQGVNIPFYRACQRLDHRTLLQDGFKEHLYFQNAATKVSEEKQGDDLSESTVPESPDPAKPILKNPKRTVSVAQNDEEDDAVSSTASPPPSPPAPLEVPVPKSEPSPEAKRPETSDHDSH